MTVRVRYSSIEYPDFDIHVRALWDTQQFADDEGHALAAGVSSAAWPLFGMLWPSGRVLARIMASRDCKDLRILEVGCGLGLSSLVLNHRGADITATDHNPAVWAFLDVNTTLNGDPRIPFVRTDWQDTESTLDRFDLIVGADVLYERHLIDDLAEFLRRRCADGGQVVIVDPGRKPRNRFCRKMEALGFQYDHRAAVADERCDDAPVAHVLTFVLP